MINVVILGISCLDGMAGSMRIRNLIEPLIEKNLIIVNNLIYENDLTITKLKKGRERNINFKSIYFKSFNLFSLCSFLAAGMKFIKLNKNTNTKNVLYNFDSPDIKNILFILFAKLVGYKIIIDIIEDHRYHPREKSAVFKFRMASSVFLLRFSRFFADAAIVISEHLYKRMVAVYNSKASIHYIPISVNMRYFCNTPSITDPNMYKIFYGGTYGDKDGLEYVFKAFEKINDKFKNVSLILSGIGPEIQMKKIYRYIKQSTHQDKIIYRGYLSTPEYFELLNDCDIFCMTRVNSEFANAGFPFKLGEFLAAGKAVIATNVGDVPFYLKDGFNAIIIPPESLDHLVEAIKTIILNPKIIPSLGIESKKTAQKYFDSEILSSKFYKILQEI